MNDINIILHTSCTGMHFNYVKNKYGKSEGKFNGFSSDSFEKIPRLTPETVKVRFKKYIYYKHGVFFFLIIWYLSFNYLKNGFKSAWVENHIEIEMKIYIHTF